MINVPVCIIGCGPIGLTGALLLSRFGIKSLLLERRGALNTHPRSRFVDTNTMELLRELGVEKEVEATGLGPDWTEFNRWLNRLSDEEYARIPSPTFHTVPRSSSPCLPVMTAQDHVESALLAKVRADSNIDLRFHTEARGLEQSETETRLEIHNLETGEVEPVTAAYTIGADGPSTCTRAVIGSELESDPMAINSQDIIFDADLSKYVGDRKGALIYATPRPWVAVIFQPLNGVRRWRCQVSVPSPELLPEAEIVERIKEALGTEDDFPITINSMSLWQPTPGCTSRFSRGRIFIAGDAAHISVPTGGMGNNTGFTGIRNLAWKLAFVLKGISPPEILETYQEEHKPVALERIGLGVQITQSMIPMMFNYTEGQDFSNDKHGTRFYGNYDGMLMGYELKSSLVAPEPSATPEVDDPIMDFVPSVRSGRRAPHVWVDEAKGVSLLDSFGSGYTLVLGAGVDPASWSEGIKRVAEKGLPISMQELPELAPDTGYENDMIVLVRPDGIIADHWRDAEVSDSERSERIERYLPLLN